ncbi:hypothetical protein OG871_05360 [Kitasatospora sp. NBC_00374]|uniref:hypothetical protein n=1 Tax=Kitasatospora sp. NBC_00374 TaxID=2975964 RepID=UPI0030E02DA5
MNWDEVTLVIVASFGCVTLLLTQISEVLSKVPQIIRAWRQVRDELGGGTHPASRGHSAGVVNPGSLPVDRNGTGRAPGEPEAARDES